MILEATAALLTGTTVNTGLEAFNSTNLRLRCSHSTTNSNNNNRHFNNSSKAIPTVVRGLIPLFPYVKCMPLSFPINRIFTSFSIDLSISLIRFSLQTNITHQKQIIMLLRDFSNYFSQSRELVLNFVESDCSYPLQIVGDSEFRKKYTLGDDQHD